MSNLLSLLSTIKELIILLPKKKSSGFDILIQALSTPRPAVVVTQPSPTVDESIPAPPCMTQMPVDEPRWLHFKIICTKPLKQLLTSTLMIHVSPGNVIKLEATRVEIHSADLFKNWFHGRRTVFVGNSAQDDSNDGAEMIIRSNQTEYNNPLDWLHVW